MNQFEGVWMCWQTGQMSERQWQEHLKDELFCAWLKRRGIY